MIKIRYLLGILCIAIGLKAMENPNPSTLDLNEYIKTHALDTSVVIAIQKWMLLYWNVMHHMIDTSECGYDKTKDPLDPEAVVTLKWDRAMKELKLLGIENWSKHNAVFQIPGVELTSGVPLIAKISGSANRSMNYIEEYCNKVLNKQRKDMTPADADEIMQSIRIHSPLAGAQGISRVPNAYYVQKLGLKNVTAPNIYLVALPGVLPTDPLDDRFYVPVQEMVKGEVLNEELFKSLDPDIVIQLAIVAVETDALWNPRYSNLVLVKGDDGSTIVYVVDTENPNRWYKDTSEEVRQLYRVNGLEMLLGHTVNNPNQYEALKAHIKGLQLNNKFSEAALNHIKDKPELSKILES